MGHSWHCQGYSQCSGLSLQHWGGPVTRPKADSLRFRGTRGGSQTVKPSGLGRRGADVWGGSKGRQRAGCWRSALSWGSRLHSFLFVVLGFWCGHAEDREQSLPGLRPEGSGNTKRYVLKNASTTKETISKVKRQPSEWGKIIANEATDKELD